MTKEEIFSIWAPNDSPWSPWVKPVLFAYVDSALAHLPSEAIAGDVNWAPPPTHGVFCVLDLPGAEGVVTGLALAEKGYRPVPLYNAVPLPAGLPLSDPLTGKAIAAVNVFPIISALRKGADMLSKRMLPAHAPPAFLLDSNRAAQGRRMGAEEFDNRSVSFTTDFPSANFLAAQGMERALLVQKERDEPQTDLAHSLCRWQDAGLVLEEKRLDDPGPPKLLRVRRPLWYRAMFQRVFARLGLRRAATGAGFGAWVPSGGSGG